LLIRRSRGGSTTKASGSVFFRFFEPNQNTYSAFEVSYSGDILISRGRRLSPIRTTALAFVLIGEGLYGTLSKLTHRLLSFRFKIAVGSARVSTQLPGRLSLATGVTGKSEKRIGFVYCASYFGFKRIAMKKSGSN
jgi:hypothetical protein